MKILVTGGNGFLGSWICRVLSQEHEVIALLRSKSDAFRLTEIKNLLVKRCESSDWAREIRESKPDVLIMADWWGVGNESRNDPRQSENISRMCELSNAALTAAIPVVIGLGSQAELGSISHQILESASDNPSTEYGIAKVQARKQMESIFHQSTTRFIWMRIFSTYGPLDTGNWLIPKIVDSLAKNRQMELTKGEQEWSYLHAYDLASAFLAVIKNEQTNGIVNVGNPQTIKLKSAIGLIAAKLGGLDLLNFGAIPYRSDQVMRLEPKCETLTEIGWSPQVTFEEGSSQTVDWLLGKESNQLRLLSGEEIIFDLPLRQGIS